MFSGGKGITEKGRQKEKGKKEKKRCQDWWFGPSTSHGQEVMEGGQKHNIQRLLAKSPQGTLSTSQQFQAPAQMCSPEI